MVAPAVSYEGVRRSLADGCRIPDQRVRNFDGPTGAGRITWPGRLMRAVSPAPQAPTGRRADVALGLLRTISASNSAASQIHAALHCN